MYWDLQKFYDSIVDVRQVLRLGAECGFPIGVVVVDLQVHLGLRAKRWASAFAEPHLVANSILAGSKFSNAYARNMFFGSLEEVHRAVPLVRVDQHVDDLAQCAVGRQTAVIKQVVEAAELITFALRQPEPGPLAQVDHTLLQRKDRSVTSERCRSSGSMLVSREGPAIPDSIRVEVQDVRWE